MAAGSPASQHRRAQIHATTRGSAPRWNVSLLLPLLTKERAGVTFVSCKPSFCPCLANPTRPTRAVTRCEVRRTVTP